MQRKGFTLVEVLVVIAIIGVLSTLAINGYSSYRESTLLDLAADNLLSQFNELRGRTIYGDTDNKRFEEIKEEVSADNERVDSGNLRLNINNLSRNRLEDPSILRSARVPLVQEENISGPAVAKCYGIYFIKEENGFSAQSFEQIFVNTKVWQESAGWVYQGCGEFDETKLNFLPLEIDAQIRITKILNGDGGELTSSLVVRFVPPTGVIEVKSDLNNFQNKEGLMEFVMQYGLQESTRTVRNLKFDLTNATGTY